MSMRLRRGRGRPIYIVKKLKLPKYRQEADRSHRRERRRSDMRAALSFLDLDLLTVEVRTYIGSADLDLGDAPDDDQDQFRDED